MTAIAEQIDQRLKDLPPGVAELFQNHLRQVMATFAAETVAATDENWPARRAQAAAALERIAARGGLAGIPDPAAWQRETRADRPLPDREA